MAKGEQLTLTCEQNGAPGHVWGVDFSAQKSDIKAQGRESVKPLLLPTWVRPRSWGEPCTELQLPAAVPALSTDIPSTTPGWSHACPVRRKCCLSPACLVLGALLHHSWAVLMLASLHLDRTTSQAFKCVTAPGSHGPEE